MQDVHVFTYEESGNSASGMFTVFTVFITSMHNIAIANVLYWTVLNGVGVHVIVLTHSACTSFARQQLSEPSSLIKHSPQFSLMRTPRVSTMRALKTSSWKATRVLCVDVHMIDCEDILIWFRTGGRGIFEWSRATKCYRMPRLH